MNKNKVLNCMVFKDYLIKSGIKEMDCDVLKLEKLKTSFKNDEMNIKLTKTFQEYVPKNIDFISSLQVSELVGKRNYQEDYIEDFIVLAEELGVQLDLDHKYLFFKEDRHYEKTLSDESVYKLIHHGNVKHENILKGLKVANQIDFDLIEDSGFDPLDPKLKLEICPEVILPFSDNEDIDFGGIFKNFKGTFLLDMKHFVRFQRRLNNENLHQLLRYSNFHTELGLLMFEQLISDREYNDEELLEDLIDNLSKNVNLDDEFVLSLIDLLDLEEVLQRVPFEYDTYIKIFDRLTYKYPSEEFNLTVHNKKLTDEEVIQLAKKYKESGNKGIERNFSLVMYRTLNTGVFDSGYNSATYFFRERDIKPYYDLTQINNLNYIYDVLRGRLVLKDNYFDCTITNMNMDKLDLTTISRKAKVGNYNPTVQLLLSNKPSKEKIDFIKRTKITDNDVKLKEIFKLNNDILSK